MADTRITALALADCPDWQSALESEAAGRRPHFEERLALTDLLAELSETRRTAFVRTHLRGFSYAETAKLTGVSVGTVQSRTARTREDLIRALRLAETPAGPRPDPVRSRRPSYPSGSADRPTGMNDQEHTGVPHPSGNSGTPHHDQYVDRTTEFGG